MRDGRTRHLKSKAEARTTGTFLERYRAMLVLVNGPAAGTEYLLDQMKIVVGRGPGVDLVFPDDAMSREHVAFEVVQDGYRARDLGSTNGIRVNGSPTLAAELEHGDRVELGEHHFQYLIEANPDASRTYQISEA